MAFVRGQQANADEERCIQREANDRAGEEAQRQREEIIELEKRNIDMLPKLLSFNEKSDKMDSYIHRFERSPEQLNGGKKIGQLAYGPY